MIASSALRVGFSGGLVVDYPNSTRAKKYFLVLAAGPPDSMPAGKDGRGRMTTPTRNKTSSGEEAGRTSSNITITIIANSD